MKQSRALIKTLRQNPKDAELISHKLLTRASFIDKALSAGIYSFLPLGWRVMQKIANIIRHEMNAIDGQEVFLPSLQPKELWRETKRWDTIDPPLFKLKDRHKKDLALGSTHEEVLTDIIRRSVKSYKDLPLYIYQIQNKFRNEMRATSGLLRVREFIMKDLYSFHNNKKDLDQYYNDVIKAYKKIFTQCGLKTKIVQASGGTIGGEITHEFQTICTTGEDKLLICLPRGSVSRAVDKAFGGVRPELQQGEQTGTKCNWAANLETQKTKLKTCPQCNGRLIEARGIENGHIFQLGTKYAKNMKAYYVDKNGKKKLIHMGCYGIGLGRLMATIVETHHDKKGIIWPSSIAPFDVHLIGIGNNELGNKNKTEKIYSDLINVGVDVLYDDREESPGIKFADADLIGIPLRIVVSKKTLEKDSAEVKKRVEEKVKLVKIKDLTKNLK